MSLLDVAALNVGWTSAQVLWDVHLHLEPGTIVALVGPNGAGKSTLLACLSGLLKPWSGEVRLDGGSIAGLPPEEIVPRGLVQVPQGRRLFADLTVRENLLMGAHHRRDRGVQTDLEAALNFFPALREKLRVAAGDLSGGQQQMCAMARALMGRPRVLLVDEPSMGLAPKAVDELMGTFQAVRATGVAVLLVEQDVAVALEVADRGYILESGRIVGEGAAGELLASADLRRAYLGEG